MSHYEGRNWRVFHRHAILCIAAYVYLVTQHLEESSTPKNTTNHKKLTVPNDYIALGTPEIATSYSIQLRHFIGKSRKLLLQVLCVAPAVLDMTPDDWLFSAMSG